MFNDGSFDTIGYTPDSTNEKPDPVKKLCELLKLVVKTEDWGTIIDILEDFPLVNTVTTEEKERLIKALTKLRARVTEKKKAGTVFASESLGDLSPEVEAILSEKEKEFGLFSRY